MRLRLPIVVAGAFSEILLFPSSKRHARIQWEV
jgi:hypothetical protein